MTSRCSRPGSPDALTAELERSPAFLLLTNTRALVAPRPSSCVREVAAALREAEAATGRTVTPVWRSDSTLRGHFWWEMQRLRVPRFEATDCPNPCTSSCPTSATAAATRWTTCTTSCRTARSSPRRRPSLPATLPSPYAHSHLPSWLEQHSERRFAAADVLSIGHEALRMEGPEHVAAVLATVRSRRSVYCQRHRRPRPRSLRCRPAAGRSIRQRLPLLGRRALHSRTRRHGLRPLLKRSDLRLAEEHRGSHHRGLLCREDGCSGHPRAHRARHHEHRARLRRAREFRRVRRADARCCRSRFSGASGRP